MLEHHDHGSVRELRLARPPANALDPELLNTLLESIREPGSADALVLSGAPGMFSGGLDVPTLLRLDEEQLRIAMERFFAVMEAIAGSQVPICAAITGHSPAGGAVLTMFCDWRVMAAGSWVIGLNEIEVGVPMPRTIVCALARLVGARRAEELVVSGRLLDPETARELGLVDRVVPAEQVIDDAIDWCTQTVARPRRTVARTRQAARADLVEAVARHWRSDLDTLLEEWFQPDAQTALNALVAKLARPR